jgi:hypothetical protein
LTFGALRERITPS